jgi:hypothetical protein
MEKMTHAEYIESLRREAGKIAAAASSGETAVLDACWALGPLLNQAELDPSDPDARSIQLVWSELDGLPLGELRAHWAPEALSRLAPQLESLTQWATPLAMPAIRSLASRFEA